MIDYKRKVAVLIRVYNRVEDLKYNLEIIQRTWTNLDYHIIVVSNGYPDGYIINAKSIKYVDNFVALEQNEGHLKGNSQLLIEGIKYIPSDCDYTIILEADTWLYKDDIVKEYIAFMDQAPNTVWASADWYDKDYALAIDFAIIKSNYIKTNPQLFNFELYPESYIANFLRDTNVGFKWIKDNMPVHVPGYVPKYPYINNASQRRFYVFPKSRMVTHHVEFVKGGMDCKKRYFNIVSGEDFFEDQKVKDKKWQRFKMLFWIGLSQLFIRKSWFQNKYYRKIPQQK